MCQKAQGESDYLVARDRHIRAKGYKAFSDGVPITNCPESDHPNPDYSDKRQWEMGWRTAEAGEKAW